MMVIMQGKILPLGYCVLGASVPGYLVSNVAI